MTAIVGHRFVRATMLAATIAATVAIGLAVLGRSAGAAEMSLRFDPIKLPMSIEERSTFTASSSVTIDGTKHAIAYNNLLKPGDKLGDVVFGQLVDINGAPMVNKDGSPNICDKPDFMSLIAVDGKVFMINQFECRPAAMYLTELSQDSATGALAPVSTRPIDFSGVNGAARHCAGMVTPWNTHLSSEEDVRDARKLKADGTLDRQYKAISAYLAGKAASPYMWGWVPEVSILNGAGDTRVVKHFAMGRLSTEIAYALPDERTVFLSEDNTNSPLAMFVADRPRDLGAGTLYAAKWTQSGDGGGAGELEWINLGHATNDQIGKLVAAPTTFDQLFDTAKPGWAGGCPAGFKSINAEFRHECLALRPGMEVAASRLETGRYAAYMGASTEFRKLEGATFDPDTNRLYVSVSRIERGMTDGDRKYDLGGPNDVRMAKNSCGAVYALDVASGRKDSTGGNIDSDYAFDRMYSLVSGSPRGYDDPALAFNKCDIEGIAEPDNLTYLPGSGVLIIAEDTARHENDIIWAYVVANGGLTRIQSTPYGSETTATYWYPNINGWGYLSSIVQDPFGDARHIPKGVAETIPADAKRSSIGYIGPFPALSN
jgi:secreted PhoX family phosphatase